MARKSAHLLPSRQHVAIRKSWAAIGVDTSMTACSVVGMGYDAMLGKMVGPVYDEIRWYPEDDWFKRLAEAARGEKLLQSILGKLWVIDPSRVYIAAEEPWYFGAVKKGQSEWLKQQAEIAGAFKGALCRWGYDNIYEINNAQWKATLRKDGVDLPSNRKDPDMKWKVKRWAIQAFGLPELPDLVKSKSGMKVPRPEEGYGAKAKAVQPNDIYDAAAMCAWMCDELERLGIAE